MTNLFRRPRHLDREPIVATIQTSALPPMPTEHASARALLRTFVIGLTAFLTVVDLFATQAILPKLTQSYGVTPAAMSFAVNSSTMGMAVAGLVVAFFSRHIDRLRVDAVVPRGTLQRCRYRGRVRGVHHRQRRQQLVRTAVRGGAGRSPRTGRELLRVRRAQSRRCRAGLFHSGPRQADGGDARARPLAAVDLGGASA